MHMPALHVPLRGILHVHHVVDGQLLSCLHILNGGDGGYKSKARMICVGPGAVWSKAVVYLVSKSGPVVGRAVVLKLESVVLVQQQLKQRQCYQ